ncbi:MAG: phosphate ABC transporter permease PtsA [Bdellovibrio sp.]|nr:MAG: phosphate ABC transporter permease PtsA [Bdellovibrio sp.]
MARDQLHQSHFRRRKLKNLWMQFLMTLATVIAIGPLLMVFFHIVALGLPSLNFSFFTELPAPTGEVGGGMGNAILGSLVMIAMASLICIPVGIGAGVFLAEFPRGSIPRTLRLVIDLLASLPSIVVGLYVYAVLVVPMKSFSAWAGTWALGILMVPIVVKTTEEVLRLLPFHYREAGLALGLSRWRVICSIVLRSRRKAILTGIFLALARIAGETAPLLITAFGNRNWPSGLGEPMASLPVQIYNYAISPFEDWHRQAWAGAFTLVSLVFALNLISRALMTSGGTRGGELGG